MYLLSIFSQLAITFLPLSKCVLAASHVHDYSFYPDSVLRATAQNISVDCQSRYSVIINGTSPGPPIYMEEGQTTWVRVYNDMADLNLTVASTYLPLLHCPRLSSNFNYCEKAYDASEDWIFRRTVLT